MIDREKELAGILARLEKNRPEFERIMRRPSLINTGRKPKPLYRIPPDMDFSAKDGNTEYEVVGYFDANADECILDKILRKLGYEHQGKY